MPRVLGAEMRALIAAEDREQLQLERSGWNKTGFTGVSKVGNGYQARIQVLEMGAEGQRSAGSILFLAPSTRPRMRP